MDITTIQWAKNKIPQLIFNTTKIEIPGITLHETEEILEKSNNGQISTEKAMVVVNIKRTWDYILGYQEEYIDLETIKTINRIVGAGIIPDAGIVRAYNVKIGGTTWVPKIPTQEKIFHDLETIYEEKDTVRQGLKRFAIIAKGQYFPDGNKRTAALAANLSLLLAEDGLFFINSDTIESDEFYRQLIDFYETDKIEEFVDWLEKNAFINIH